MPREAETRLHEASNAMRLLFFQPLCRLLSPSQ